jgi:hypothetical protein
MKKFIGTGVALVTPFTSDFAVDVQALERIVAHVTKGGVEYLVVLGTTAETATLSKEEKALVIQTVVAANAQKLPLVLGVGGNNTAEVVAEYIFKGSPRAFLAKFPLEPCPYHLVILPPPLLLIRPLPVGAEAVNETLFFIRHPRRIV